MPRVSKASLMVAVVLVALCSLQAMASTMGGGYQHAVYIGDDGELYAMGHNGFGELGAATGSTSTKPVKVTLPGGVKPVKIADDGKGNSTYVLGDDGKVYSWGRNDSGQLGDGTMTHRIAPTEVTLPSGTKVSDLSSGEAAAYVVTGDGRIYAWGDNSFGQLGTGDANESATPVEVILPEGVRASKISAGSKSGYALGSDGKLYGWGFNATGQLGDGTMSDRTTPVAVKMPNGLKILDVSAGGGSAYALAEDGTVYSWGMNASGQLGDGTLEDSLLPTSVHLPEGVTAATLLASSLNGYIIDTQGRIFGWGRNKVGQLGDGTETDRLEPVEIKLPGSVKAADLSVGGYTAFAIAGDGSIFGWGYNAFGQLGDGTKDNRFVPFDTGLRATLPVRKESAPEPFRFAPPEKTDSGQKPPPGEQHIYIFTEMF